MAVFSENQKIFLPDMNLFLVTHFYSYVTMLISELGLRRFVVLFLNEHYFIIIVLRRGTIIG